MAQRFQRLGRALVQAGVQHMQRLHHAPQPHRFGVALGHGLLVFEKLPKLLGLVDLKALHGQQREGLAIEHFRAQAQPHRALQQRHGGGFIAQVKGQHAVALQPRNRGGRE